MLTVLAVAILTGTLAAIVGCVSREAQAKREISLGINDYQNAKYESAIRHFQRAVALDPRSADARRYLVAIGSPNTPSNNEYAEAAIQEYERVLKSSPNQIEAIEGLAYLHFQLAHYDAARRYYLRASELDRDDPENYYSAGVIDWTESYQLRMVKRVQLSLKQDAPLIWSRECVAIREKNWARIEEGIAMLTRALALRPDYTDAMAYLNLLYRERADIQCGDRNASEMDLRQAEYWTDRAVAAMKHRKQDAPISLRRP